MLLLLIVFFAGGSSSQMRADFEGSFVPDSDEISAVVARAVDRGQQLWVVETFHDR